MSKYDSHTIRLKANEIMLNSKGFLLFSVDVDGQLIVVGDTTELNNAESRGLQWFRQTVELEGIEIGDDE